MGQSVFLSWLYLYFLSALVAAANWFHRFFGRVEIDQALYHLQLSSSNIFRADSNLVVSAVRNIALAPVLYALLLLLAWKGVARLWGKSSMALTVSAPALRPLGLIALFAGAGFYFAQQNLIFADTSAEEGDWIAGLYVPPKISSKPDRKRNLVLIYAESLEASLQRAFPDDPFFEDLRLEKYQPTTFRDFRQLKDTGWTIAGIVGSQCGLPLKPIGLVNGRQLGDFTTRFIPKATCLGDLLKSEGYRNVFIGGASRKFAGKRAFLESHGYAETFGRRQFQKMNPAVPLNGWGVYDDELFKFAKRKFVELEASGKPFNLTVLTVGMHGPGGELAPACASPRGDYRDTIYCTAALIKDFVNFVESESRNDGVEIVIVGDHLAMQSPAAQALEGRSDRRIFNLFIGPQRGQQPNRSEIDHFDLLPTILARLDYGVNEGRAGLGCAGFGTVPCDTLAHDAEIDAKLARHSDFYDSLWLDKEAGTNSTGTTH